MPTRPTSTRRTATPDPAGSGYRSAQYAKAFSDVGRPCHLPRSGGWLIERAIAGTGFTDAMGLYPLFGCTDWSALADDLEAARDGWISATLVADPLGDPDEAVLKRSFDLVVPYKTHFIAEMTGPPETFVSKSHRQNARRALHKVTVEICDDPLRLIDDWVALYAMLVRKHGVSGLRAFSRDSFSSQLAAPGLVMFRAVMDGETVGLDLWYVDGDVAQGHLAAFNEQGYASSAAYGTKWTMLNHFFAQGISRVNFGGLAGAPGTDSSGLAHFKKGWSNTTRPAYLCGRIFDEAAYRQLARKRADTHYFPAYRAGEFPA